MGQRIRQHPEGNTDWKAEVVRAAAYGMQALLKACRPSAEEGVSHQVGKQSFLGSPHLRSRFVVQVELQLEDKISIQEEVGLSFH